MKNFKLIKESWDRFVTEQEELPFMAIKAPIKGKIEEINKQVDELISGGAIFFDTETMGLDAVKPAYGATPTGKKPSETSAFGTLQEAKLRRPVVPPLVLPTTTNGVQGQMLTEIAAAYATAKQIVSGEFPEEKSRSHSRITIPDENKKEISDFGKKYYKEGTVEFDTEKYFEGVKSKIKLAIAKQKIIDIIEDQGKETDQDLNNLVKELGFQVAYRIPAKREYQENNYITKEQFNSINVSEDEVKEYYDEKIRDSVSSIKTPHQLLLMTAYFGSEEEVMGKIRSGQISIEDFINLNPEVMKQPTDTDSVSEEEAIKRFYDYAKDHSGIPLVAQNAGFDEGFISKRAEIYGLGAFKQLGLTNVRDTLNLFASFRKYLMEIISMGEDAKTKIKEEITRISGGNTPEQIIATLTTAKGRPTVSQGPMASALKVEATRWHTAIADIEILFKIFSSVIMILKQIESLDSGASMSNIAPRKGKLEEDMGKFDTAPDLGKVGATEPTGFKGGDTEPTGFKGGDTESPAISQAVGLMEYLNNVIALSQEGVKRIEVFKTAIQSGGSSGPLPESKKVSKKPIRENKTITIRIGKW